MERFRQSLKVHNLSDFKKLDPKLIIAMDEVLAVDLPKLMALFPQGNRSLPAHERNPFESDEAVAGGIDNPWLWQSVERSRYVIQFQSLHPVDGKVDGQTARPVLMESGLPTADLGVIWQLADRTRDGYLDSDEFSLAMHLIRLRLAGVEMPAELPATMLPPKTII